MSRLNPFFRPMRNTVQLCERHWPVNGVVFASSPLPPGRRKAAPPAPRTAGSAETESAD